MIRAQVAAGGAGQVAARPRFSAIACLSWACTLLAVACLFGMLALFAWQSVPIWEKEGLSYLAGKQWFYRNEIFGMLPMVYGSLAVAAIALVLAAPVGLGAAVGISEYLPNSLRLGAKVGIELLAGVPSVVYGLLGILFLRNWLYEGLDYFEPLSGDMLLTGGILLAVMVLPTIVTLGDDALRAVPFVHRQAARGLGLTRGETILHVALPQARGGLIAAVLLGLGRAMGETIAVFLVIGRQDNQWPERLWSLQPVIEAGQTLTTKLGGSEINIAYGTTLHWAAMVGLGLVLMLVVGLLTWLGAWLSRRKEPDAA